MKILKRDTLQDFENWFNPVLEEGGIILIDKAYKLTSFDIIAKLRRILKVKKIGHGGTLDPLATGLLIVCVGRPATRLADYYQAFPKEYICRIHLGATTKTYDLESEPENFTDISHITEEAINSVLAGFVGEIEQTPPQHSAVKVNGKRAYELARKDEDFQLKSRKINIYSINDVKISLPEVEFKVTCSKGTYIRSLANDIGEKLDCGAYLSGLIRSKIADFAVEDALSLEDVAEAKGKVENEKAK